MVQGQTTVQAGTTTLRTLDDKESEILSTLPSLRVTYVIPGDLVYIPYASLICEKACGGHAVSLRVASCLMTAEQQEATRFMREVFNQPLGFALRLL